MALLPADGGLPVGGADRGERVRTWHWGNVRTLGLLALGAAALLAWGRAEARSSSPLVDMTLMRLRGVWPANAAALLIGLGMYASFLIIPELVQAPARLGYGFGAPPALDPPRR